MLGELRRQMLCRPPAYKDRTLDVVYGCFAAWYFDEKLGSALHLTRETLVERHAVCPIQQVELVVAWGLQVLESFAYHYATAGAGEHATAIVRDIDALPQQMV